GRLAHPGGKFQIDKWHFTSNTTTFYEVRVLSKINVGTPVYYDLSELKIRKKIPLMIKHFEDFLRLLPSRDDSQLSWTVDMDARKQAAAEQARPLKEKATAKGQQAAQWSQRVADLKKAKPRNDQAIEEAEIKVKELTRESRDLAGKAKEIEDAVYDLKAVNPNKKPNVDARTPEELMNIIEAKGKEVAAALAALRGKRNSV
ncbi:MAG: hypothetical protein KKG96_08860, partial [Proteobacteria bacterium]|nr:hypothetical protein [Pseudomonadota bacterium]